MNSKNKLAATLILVMFFPAAVLFAAEPQVSLDAKVIYNFRENLEKAQIWVMGEKTAAGKWAGNKFLFPELSVPFEVRSGKMPYEGLLKEGVYVTLLHDAPARLIFPDVPAGGMILFEGGVDDGSVLDPTQKPTTIYVTVWAGKLRLKRIAMPAVKGWQKTAIPLGPAQFLTGKIPVSFEIAIDDSSKRNFSFSAQVLQ